MSQPAMNGKGSKFLNSFWDLASDDARARCLATKRIIMHVNEMQKKSDEEGMCSDGEYAIQRLVRGLSSSRDSARQGFSACLCQFLVSFPIVEISVVIKMINDNTRISSSMRGTEERDLMFGRLFGYLALIRSGKLSGDNINIVKTLDTLIDLHQRKAWIREVVSESILYLLQQFNFEADQFDSDVALSVVSKLNEILPAVETFDVGEVPAHLLVLLTGLQQFEERVQSSCGADICEAMASLSLPSQAIITAEAFEVLVPTLLAACSGFPKIHRVWYTIMSSIFGVEDADRQLPAKRVDSINATQEALLMAFVSFIDENLVQHGSSHEKRGVFLKLINDLLRLTPANLVSIVLSKSMVRCLVSIRANKKHTLFALAGVTLTTLAATAAGDARGCLAIANTLVQHEGAMFDTKTNSSTVRDLLTGLDADMVLSYVHTLCGVIAKTLASAATSGEEDGDDEAKDSAEQAMSAVLALAAIVKNPRVADRGNLAAIIVAVLVRVSCFSLQGRTPSCSWAALTPKKGSKKSKKTTAAATFNAFADLNMREEKDLINSMVEVVQMVETCEDMTVDSPVIEQLIKTARTSLLNVLADVGHVSIDHLNRSLALMENDKPDNNERRRSDSMSGDDNMFSLLHFALSLFIYLSESGLVLIVDDQEDEEMEGKDCTKKVKIAFQSLLNHLKFQSSNSRLVNSCTTFLGQSVFHVMCSEEVSQESLEVIAEIIPSVPQTIYLKTNNDKSLQLRDEDNDEEDGEGDEGDDGFQTALFEACMDLVAVSEKHPVKGVRDATKRVWTSIVQYCLVESSVIESILACVVGDDVEGAADSSKGGDDEAEHREEDEEEEDEDSEDEGEVQKTKKQNRKLKAPDEDEEDILLDEESTMKMLEGSDSDGDSDGEGSRDDDESSVVDEEGMDAALANMIQMRKQNRKQGLLQAKRQELIMRSRAIDVLEVFIHRNEDTSVLLPMFFPLLYCLKKITNSSIVQSLQEGRTFEQRVRSLIENRLCKAKFSIVVDGEEAIGVFVESTSELLQFLVKCLRSASVAMRVTATNSFLCVARGVLSGNMAPTVDLLSSAFKELLEEYFNKKNGRVPVKIVDEMFNRFPDFATAATLNDVVRAGESAPSLFLRTDAFRLLSALLKKNSSLSTTTQQLLQRQINAMVECTTNTIEANEDMKAKRMKSILQFAKDLAHFVRHVVAEGNSSDVDVSSVESFIAALSGSGAADSKQNNSRDAICEILSAIPLGMTSKSSKSGGKKQKEKKSSGEQDVAMTKVKSGTEGLKKSGRKKRGSAEINDDDENFVDYERQMINRMAAEARKQVLVDEEESHDQRPVKNKSKKQKNKK